jgi:hypothetical protein
MTRTAGGFALVLILVLSAGPASAQDGDFVPSWSASAVASTLGFGLELTGRSNPLVGIRGGYFLYSHTWRSEVEGIDYDLTPKLRNGEVLLDLHPGAGIFRLSGGILFAGTRVEAVGVTTGPIDIGGTTYPPSDIGTLTGKVEWDKSIVPYVGIGVASQARFTVTFDLGIGFAGYPKVALKADSPLTGAELAELEASLEAEEAQIQREIESKWWAKFYPVVSIGLKYRF